MRFLDSLIKAKNDGKQVVIPDIKVFSPKEGDLMKGRSPVEYATSLVEAGAPVISVVTEEKEFHGSVEMLKSISLAVDVPILRKDFIHTREDLEATKEAGASAILLMCSCLTPDEMKYLYKEALALGLDPFVETHKKEDFALVRELGAMLVGINNRDILVLERDEGDVNHTLSLIESAPEGAFLVTESSIKNPEQVRKAIRSGADAALVGTAIANAPDPAVFYKMLTKKTSVKICGFMNEKDIEMAVNEGVERIGLVVEYPLEVPWNLEAERAADLRKHIPEGYTCCMVTGGSDEDILEKACIVRPDMVQLHYKEDLESCQYLSGELKKMGIAVIKTVPVNTEECLERFGTTDIKEAVGLLCRTEVAELLVDPRNTATVKEKNLHADETLFADIQAYSTKPVILAGGLNAENTGDIIARTGALYIDVMNGSEDNAGKKNRDKIRKILKEAERASSEK